MSCQGRLLGSLSFVVVFMSACGGPHQGWTSFPVPIYADRTVMASTEAQNDLKDAFHFWESKTGKQLFEFKGEWKGPKPFEGDPSNPTAILGNVIFFENPWPFTPTTVGMTTVKSSTAGIDSAMIMINPDTSFCTGDCLYDYRTSQRKTFTHELGHFLGLGHVEDPNNIMYPTSLPGGALNSVSVDTTALRVLTDPNQ